MIIKGLSAFSTEANNAPTAANYPALKHFWPCNEATTSAGAGVGLLDTVGGVTITGITTGAITNNADYTVTLTQNGGPSVTGTLATIPAGKCPVIVWLGAPASGDALVFGENTSGAITHGISPNSAHVGIKLTATAAAVLRFHDGGGSASFTCAGTRTGTGDWAAYAMSLEYTATGMKAYSYGANNGECLTSTGTSLVEAGDAVTTAGPATVITTWGAAVTVPAGIAMLAVFYFDDVPTDMHEALSWMTDNMAATGEKVIYPGWIGRS